MSLKGKRFYLDDVKANDYYKTDTYEVNEMVERHVFFEEDVKEVVNDYTRMIKTLLNKNSISGLSEKDIHTICEIMEKYDIKPVERGIDTYKHILYIHDKIFGRFDK